MKTERELNTDILEITLAIAKFFPELSKYLLEMPIKISSNKGKQGNILELTDYYESLNVLFIQYALRHNSTPKLT